MLSLETHKLPWEDQSINHWGGKIVKKSREGLPFKCGFNYRDAIDTAHSLCASVSQVTLDRKRGLGLAPSPPNVFALLLIFPLFLNSISKPSFSKQKRNKGKQVCRYLDNFSTKVCEADTSLTHRGPMLTCFKVQPCLWVSIDLNRPYYGSNGKASSFLARLLCLFLTGWLRQFLLLCLSDDPQCFGKVIRSFLGPIWSQLSKDHRVPSKQGSSGHQHLLSKHGLKATILFLGTWRTWVTKTVGRKIVHRCAQALLSALLPIGEVRGV